MMIERASAVPKGGHPQRWGVASRGGHGGPGGKASVERDVPRSSFAIRMGDKQRSLKSKDALIGNLRRLTPCHCRPLARAGTTTLLALGAFACIGERTLRGKGAHIVYHALAPAHTANSDAIMRLGSPHFFVLAHVYMWRMGIILA